ncbi:hypothetical protein [Pleionea sp. CnH1-48]|uniref:hypothetical protein n=1 Tax=Pleionea sp. CnH1-48 TaxID=2954494 RepID=UPI002097FAF6|nr:hypothetical protein [Pleionea sp. CnH1-48]MCO7223054.1 hypothetical protein [Pleionea sp. CnH1-48]
MNKLMPVLLLLGAASVFAQEKEQDKEDKEKKENAVVETTKSVVSGIVSFGKDLVSGATDGVSDGRKQGSSSDDALVVDNVKGLDKHLKLKVLSVKTEESTDSEKTKSSQTYSFVELGFKNDGNEPVRVINLRDAGNIIAIDKDGYATNLAGGKGNPDDVTIPPKAGKKQKFYFPIEADNIEEIRLMGKTLSM